MDKVYIVFSHYKDKPKEEWIERVCLTLEQAQWFQKQLTQHSSKNYKYYIRLYSIAKV